MKEFHGKNVALIYTLEPFIIPISLRIKRLNTKFLSSTFK